MADEHFNWLSEEAAERLLRGEPLDAVDDHEQKQAERLAELLDSVRTARRPGTSHAERHPHTEQRPQGEQHFRTEQRPDAERHLLPAAAPRDTAAAHGPSGAFTDGE
ncbi:hypothetical protein P8605_46965, partial [Streptomyces sp. T-3]|nr:hypothetical protein [Streptomyces sp. T-3]